MNKKIVIFFWIAAFSISFFYHHHHQLAKKEILFSHFSSSRRKRVIILKDERWKFSWKDQILYFIVIFIVFSFLVTVITKKYNDRQYDQDRKGTVRFLTRLYYKNISPFKIEPVKKGDSFERYKILNGPGRKKNLFGIEKRCFFIEYIIYFQLFYNFLFYVLDLLIFPMIRAFFRKKKKENLMDCVDQIIENKFYFSEDGLELLSMFFISPMAVYVLYRFLAFLVLRICFGFEQTLATKMMTMAKNEGKKILREKEGATLSKNKKDNLKSSVPE